VRNFRLGRIKAAVWENEADQKKFYNVTFARTYMDDAKAYHDTDSFGRDDLPLVAKLADQAHTFIFERLAELKLPQGQVGAVTSGAHGEEWWRNVIGDTPPKKVALWAVLVIAVFALAFMALRLARHTGP
jgi:hypothetical protein